MKQRKGKAPTTKSEQINVVVDRSIDFSTWLPTKSKEPKHTSRRSFLEEKMLNHKSRIATKGNRITLTLSIKIRTPILNYNKHKHDKERPEHLSDDYPCLPNHIR